MKNSFRKLDAKSATIIGIAVIAVMVIGIGAVYGLGLGKQTGAPDKTASAATTTSSVQTEVTEVAKVKESTKETQKETSAAKTTKTETKSAKNTAAAGTEKTKKETKEKRLYCTLMISCKTALSSDELKDSKRNILPSDGVVYGTKKVEFQKGDSAYDILKRETKKSGIQMEATFSAGTGTQYVEGIANLYEFDCGGLSGWMYRVNGNFPSYGCSKYKVKKGDRIEFLYTCEKGDDL